MRRAAAKDLAATKDPFHLAIGDLHAIDGLLAVQLILKIDRGRAGSPVRSAEKPALGHLPPFFNLEIIKNQSQICFVKSRDISPIRSIPKRNQTSALQQK